jgi:hypothetical protein
LNLTNCRKLRERKNLNGIGTRNPVLHGPINEGNEIGHAKTREQDPFKQWISRAVHKKEEEPHSRLCFHGDGPKIHLGTP